MTAPAPKIHPARRGFVLRWAPRSEQTTAMRRELDALIDSEMEALEARVTELEKALAHSITTIEAAYRYSHVVGSADKRSASYLAGCDTKRLRAILKGGAK